MSGRAKRNEWKHNRRQRSVLTFSVGVEPVSLREYACPTHNKMHVSDVRLSPPRVPLPLAAFLFEPECNTHRTTRRPLLTYPSFTSPTLFWAHPSLFSFSSSFSPSLPLSLFFTPLNPLDSIDNYVTEYKSLCHDPWTM